MEQTLLQKAKALKKKKKDLSDEVYQLCLAYARDEVSLKSVQQVLGYKQSGSIYPLMLRAFRRYVIEHPQKKTS